MRPPSAQQLLEYVVQINKRLVLKIKIKVPRSLLSGEKEVKSTKQSKNKEKESCLRNSKSGRPKTAGGAILSWLECARHSFWFLCCEIIKTKKVHVCAITQSSLLLFFLLVRNHVRERDRKIERDGKRE
jgi:hypothetical protein